MTGWEVVGAGLFILFMWLCLILPMVLDMLLFRVWETPQQPIDHMDGYKLYMIERARNEHANSNPKGI